MNRENKVELIKTDSLEEINKSKESLLDILNYALERDDKPVKTFNARDWWNSLDKKWRIAFSFAIGKNDLIESPTDEELQRVLNLKKITCWNIRIDSLEPIRKTKQIKELYCSFNHITTLEPIKDMKNLTKLFCWNNQIESLEPLRNMKQMAILDFRNNKITSLEPIMELSNIKEIHWRGNDIPLEEMKEFAKLHSRLGFVF